MLIACFFSNFDYKEQKQKYNYEEKKQKKLGINFIIRKIKYVKEEDIEKASLK